MPLSLGLRSYATAHMHTHTLPLTGSAKGNERRDFLQEIEMMKKVSEGQNPHVVSMVGCVTTQEPLCLITEFVPYGNLLQYLRTNQRLVGLVLHHCLVRA